MRPASIERFEALYFTSLAIGVLSAAVSWQTSVSIASPAFVITVQIATFAILLSLILLISRRRSDIARWMLAILFVLGAIVYIPAAGSILDSSPVLVVLSAFQLIFQAIALYYVFSPAARVWFKGV